MSEERKGSMKFPPEVPEYIARAVDDPLQAAMRASYLDKWARDVLDFDYGMNVTEMIYRGRNLFVFRHIGIQVAVLATDYMSGALAVKTMLSVGDD